MIDINGYEISKAFTGGEPVSAIYSFGVKVWPVTGPVEFGGLKFTALEAGSFGMEHNGTNATTTKPNLSYSKNGGSWIEWDYTNIPVVKDDFIYFKGVNNRISNSISDYSTFTSTGRFNASGNIMSLLYCDDYEGKFDLTGREYCFDKLFYDCYGLVNAPALPATTLASGCYSYMFYGCNSLISAPELPATTLASNCYDGMFWSCGKITTAPLLPATTLSNSCYANMFRQCRITTAPELPATKLASKCYENMFMFCGNLNYIKANFTTKPSTSYTKDWLYGVAETGTFVANPSATWTTSITRNESTVPSGWTIEKDPISWGGLKFTALEAGEIGMTHNGTNATTTKPSLSYSKNGGSWVKWDYTPISVVTDDFIYFKGINDSISTSSSNYSTFTSTGRFASSGNIMSLLYSDDYEGKISLSGKNYCFFKLLFNCSTLNTAPELPATTLGISCYNFMFSGCTSLTTSPELPATVLVKNCYYSMFAGCTNLNYVKADFITEPSSKYTSYWLDGVASTGIFVANPSATWTDTISRNRSTVPAGWTIQK